MSTPLGYNLLIENYSSEIIKCIENSKHVLIKGPTGCGKSTYIPLLLNNNKHKIAVIEPRRIAVMSLYSTLFKVTKNVGYKMRFNKKIKHDDKIIIFTDGAFLHEGIDSNYDYIILDEVHERSIRMDMILCLLKQTKSKVILMSATVDTKRIMNYFDAKLFEIPGESYPCDIIYSESSVSDYILESYNIIKEIVMSKDVKNLSRNNSIAWLDKSNKNKDCYTINNNRDILVFLTGEEDINDLFVLLKKILDIKVYKIFSSLNDEEQLKIYQKSTIRKVILSTNICEISLTIPGIKYVIDCGLVKNKIFDGINYFGIVPISKESADQRLGRCNRIGPGICYRLFTEEMYNNLSNLTPEILIANLSKPILQLIHKKIDIFNFSFLDYPTQLNVFRSLEFLYNKKLINENMQITKQGIRILRYPFELNLSCFYDDCINSGLGYYGSMLVSMISIDNYNFIKNLDMVQGKNIDKEMFTTDIKYLINIFSNFLNAKVKKEFCKINEISLKNLDKAYKIFKGLNKNKNGNVDLLEKIFSKSFDYNLSVREQDGSYKHVASGRKLYIHPTSNFFKKNIKKIVFVDVLCTTKEYIRIVGKYL